MKNILHAIWGHTYKVKDIQHYHDISYKLKSPSSTIIYQCEHCKKIKQKNMYGAGFLDIKNYE